MGVGEPDGQNEPAGQAAQLAASLPPVALRNVPSRQGSMVSLSDSDGQKKPAAHSPVGSEAPSTQKLPGGQETQVDIPLYGAWVPGRQGVGTAMASGQNEPRGHA